MGRSKRTEYEISQAQLIKRLQKRFNLNSDEISILKNELGDYTNALRRYSYLEALNEIKSCADKLTQQVIWE